MLDEHSCAEGGTYSALQAWMGRVPIPARRAGGQLRADPIRPGGQRRRRHPDQAGDAQGRALAALQTRTAIARQLQKGRVVRHEDVSQELAALPEIGCRAMSLADHPGLLLAEGGGDLATELVELGSAHHRTCCGATSLWSI